MTRPEMQQRFTSLVSAYRSDPSCANAREIRRFAGLWLHTYRHLSSVGPVCGIMDATAERHKLGVLAGLLHKFALWYFKRFVLTPDRPGWNDYWMIRWQLTNNQAALAEIHRRACHLTEHWPEVERTARWMVSSYRHQDEQVNFQMLAVERDCPMCVLVS